MNLSAAVAAVAPVYIRSPYRVVGIDDEVTTCEHCGKPNLKCTVAMEHEDTGEIVRYGRDCAARALQSRIGGKTLTADKMEMKARHAEIDIIEAELRARGLLHRNTPTPGAEILYYVDPRYPKYPKRWGWIYRLNDGRAYIRLDYVSSNPALVNNIIPGRWKFLVESRFVGWPA